MRNKLIIRKLNNYEVCEYFKRALLSENDKMCHNCLFHILVDGKSYCKMPIKNKKDSLLKKIV